MKTKCGRKSEPGFPKILQIWMDIVSVVRGSLPLVVLDCLKRATRRLGHDSGLLEPSLWPSSQFLGAIPVAQQATSTTTDENLVPKAEGQGGVFAKLGDSMT